MKRVHILTKGFASPNGIAFLFPIYANRRLLNDLGIAFGQFGSLSAEVTDCDALVVDSRYYSRRWANDATAVLAEIEWLSEAVPALFYFDISDSTGWLQSQVLPFVTRYYKSQILADRKAYLQPHYGNRIYADYYHRNNGATDEAPVPGRPVERREYLGKLGVSWNSGLANYSLFGPALMGLRHYLPCNLLFRFPRNFAAPDRPRPHAVACRFGVDYARATVAYQRKRIREMLAARMPTGKISRRAYLAEMRNTRVVISPFGFGEITLKDFEVFLCGAALMKPDMAHLETWPDFYRDGDTMIAHRWDLSDFEAVLERAIADEKASREVAARGQERYRFHVATEDGKEAFCLRFKDMVTV